MQDKKIPVAVLGATGSVGQRFVQLLEHHPWFELAVVTGSERRVGKVYEETCHWVLAEPMPDNARRLKIQPTTPDAARSAVAFSALPSGVARELEPLFAQSGVAVFSNASAYRQEPDVPILLPEVNPQHLDLAFEQRRRRGWSGFIVTNPNCTSTGATVALKALSDAFGLRRVFLVSLQAVSGAGYPGVASMDILDNVIPYISNEEEKLELEPRKMLGELQDGKIQLADFAVSAHTNRVAVSDGHTVCLSVEVKNPATVETAVQALQSYAPPPVSRKLPSAPAPVIEVRSEPDRPQPRLDRMSGAGMTTVVGRIRRDPLFHFKLVVLSHNTIRGAAGGSLYNAELALATGLLSD